MIQKQTLVEAVLFSCTAVMMTAIALMFQHTIGADFDSPSEDGRDELDGASVMAWNLVKSGIDGSVRTIFLVGYGVYLVWTIATVVFAPNCFNLRSVWVWFLMGMFSVFTVHVVYVAMAPSAGRAQRHEHDWLKHRTLINYVCYWGLLITTSAIAIYFVFVLSIDKLLQKCICGMSIVFCAFPLALASLFWKIGDPPIIGLVLCGIALACLLAVWIWSSLCGNKTAATDSSKCLNNSDDLQTADGAGTPLLYGDLTTTPEFWKSEDIEKR